MKLINDKLLTTALLLIYILLLNLSFIFFVQAKAVTKVHQGTDVHRLRQACTKVLKNKNTSALLPQALPLTDRRKMA